MKFKTTLWAGKTKDVTGIVVPDEVVEALGGGKRAPVRVTVNGHSYASSIGSMGGRSMISVSKANREAAGLTGGDEIEVEIVLDTGERVVDMPDDFAAALDASSLRPAFDALPYSHRKEHVRAINEAKKPETRARRIEKAVEMIAKKAK